jgi:hypothetical protein
MLQRVWKCKVTALLILKQAKFRFGKKFNNVNTRKNDMKSEFKD